MITDGTEGAIGAGETIGGDGAGPSTVCGGRPSGGPLDIICGGRPSGGPLDAGAEDAAVPLAGLEDGGC